tara:strand:+ start:166 stop:2436 length:2271 start_codon:yes stop_codon:yes gene_type:complete
MANPIIFWTEPLNSPATVDEPHILRNDLVTISRKAPSSPAIPGVTAGAYYARFNDVDRTDVPETTTPNPSGPSTTTPAHTTYTFVDRGHIGLDGGVFELLPFSSGVSPATTVTFTDFAGIGLQGYPTSGTTLNNTTDVDGPLICGAFTNVEVQTSYSISPMVVAPSSTGTFGTGANPGSANPGSGPDASPVLTNATLQNGFESFFGDTTGPTITLFRLTGNPPGQVESDGTGGFEVAGTENRISELYTVGGTLSPSNGTVPSVHRGAINFDIRPDTEAIIAAGNESKTQTGTASWAAGQDRTMTVTTSSAHGLADQYNRVHITGSSNNAMNGLWNVATVTSDTQFTIKLFAAQCGPSAITSSVNVVTYDGIDKKGGVLRQQTGTINTIQKVVILSPAIGSGPSATPATHSINYRYTGSHGLGSSGTVTASVSGSGLASGTHGSNPIPAGDFTGSVTIDSGTQFTRSVASGLAGASGTVSGTVSTLASGLSAKVFNASDDLEVVAGGMFGNNQVILKGEVSSQVVPNIPYSFHGNTTSSEVSTIFFTGSTRERTMFRDAGFKLNSSSGRVFTEGAPDTQPSGTDGMPGGFDPNNNPAGGVKEIDNWCPRFMHAKAKALERNDVTELLKANTSGKFELDQLLASPIVDESENITTFLSPREKFQETCWFTMRAFKNPSHRRPGQTSFVEGEDVIERQFGINVFNNTFSDRNEITLDFIDQTNKIVVANTDTAFVIDGESVTNQAFLNNGYANGNFKNQ